ncbi:MAG: hypothetical protein ACOC07_19970 [Coleofasciculus sp.]
MTTVPTTVLESTYPYYGLKTVAPSQFHPSVMLDWAIALLFEVEKQ